MRPAPTLDQVTQPPFQGARTIPVRGTKQKGVRPWRLISSAPEYGGLHQFQYPAMLTAARVHEEGIDRGFVREHCRHDFAEVDELAVPLDEGPVPDRDDVRAIVWLRDQPIALRIAEGRIGIGIRVPDKFGQGVIVAIRT